MMAILTSVKVVAYCSSDLHFSNNYQCWASFQVPVAIPINFMTLAKRNRGKMVFSLLFSVAFINKVE